MQTCSTITTTKPEKGRQKHIMQKNKEPNISRKRKRIIILYVIKLNKKNKTLIKKGLNEMQFK